MYKQIRMFPSHSFEKATGAGLLCGKAFELPHHPGAKCQIDISNHGIKRRRRVSPIVCDPPPKERIDLPGDVGHRQLGSMAEPKFPDRRPHGLHRRDTDCGGEPAEQCVVSGILDQPRPKAVAEKVKFDVRILASETWISLIFALAFALALLLEIAGGWRETTRPFRRRLLQASLFGLGVMTLAVVAYREGWEAVLFLLIFLAIWRLASIGPAGDF